MKRLVDLLLLNFDSAYPYPAPDVGGAVGRLGDVLGKA